MTSALAVVNDQKAWTDDQAAALKQLGVSEASTGDLAVFLHQSQRTGLDPFARQIYMIGRWDSQSKSKKWTIQASIDGLRLVARRAADQRREVLGYEDTLWCGPDGQWRDVWLDKAPPAAAKVVVVRGVQRFSAVARWASYVQTKNDGNVTAMWQRMGDVMLAKCAEALALRKAFPQDLSGIYSDDEMQPATAGPQTAAGGEAAAQEPGTAPSPADPRNNLKRQVVIEGRRLGLVTGNGGTLDLAALLDDYSGWSRGELLPDATVEQLTAYLAHLQQQTGPDPGGTEPDPWADDPQTASEVDGDDAADRAGA